MQNLTAGESLRILMKREGVKQVELAEKLDLDKRTVSHTIKLFDDNRGTIKTLIEYAEALGYNVKIEFYCPEIFKDDKYHTINIVYSIVKGKYLYNLESFVPHSNIINS